VIIAKESSTRTLIPEGDYVAVCTRVIDLGDQFSQLYGKTNRKVMFCWELPECTVDVEGKPMPKMTSREFTLNLGEKSNLRPFLQSWRGKAFTEDELKGFDLRNLLGAPAYIQIIHNEKGSKTYDDINSIMRLPKGMEKPTPATELLYVDFEADDFLETLSKLPEWVRDKVKASPQYKEIIDAKAEGGETKFVELNGDEEDLPF
jgi:hypothetical protein